MNTQTFTTVISVFCVEFDASISSGHRTVVHNTAVGGASNSQHLGWKAADLVLDNWSRKDEAIAWLRKLGLFVLDEVAARNHIHCDDRNNVNF